MPPVRLLPLALLLACSEYDLNSKHDEAGRGDDSGDGGPDTDGDDDSGYTDTDPRVCESRSIPAQDAAQNEECFQEGPTVGTFTPVVEWRKNTFSNASGSNNVMMMPAVGSLTDDDGDGDADADDVPDIVLITYGSGDVIRVLSGDGGREILTIQNSGVQGQGGVALGDVDGDGWTDIVVPTTSKTIKAYDHTGALLWTSASLSASMYGTCDNPAISDMDGDGRPEIVVGSAILSSNGRTAGTGRHGIAGANGMNVGSASFAVDVDGDGEQEVVVGNALYAKDGTVLWYNREDDGYPAVGNFDADDDAEIVVAANGKIRLQDSDGTVLCRANVPGADGSGYFGGPPTVADFDGDGEAEFAAATGSAYSVFEKDCSVKWTKTTQDGSSGNTGSSVFDFEGDGMAEAVYGDEVKLWVFAGPDGSVKLQSSDHSNNTWLEYPAIADIDGDDQAEIVVANTPSGGGNHTGITVIGDADGSWRSGRKIWNQHAYHITNVNDDGTIPAVADRNWLSYNNFRSGDLFAGGGYSGPDLVASVYDVCTDECDRGKLTVWVTVANLGYDDVEDDVTVVLYGEMDDGSETTLDFVEVTDTMRAGRRLEGLTFTIDPVPAGLKDVRAEIDGGNGGSNGVVDECKEDNNEDDWQENLCP